MISLMLDRDVQSHRHDTTALGVLLIIENDELLRREEIIVEMGRKNKKRRSLKATSFSDIEEI
jgi:hypothetical protein